MRIERLGGLQVRITGGVDGRGGGNGPLVVLLHGFGAPGDDLVSLSPLLETPRGTRFAFPEGPLSLRMGFGESRAWWMLDLEGLQRERAAGRARDLSRDIPAGLSDARTQMIALLGEMEHRLGGDPRKTVLGGFSQGAMLALDIALRMDRPFAGLVLLSGTLVAKQEWVPLMPKRRGLPVLQSHGSADTILPFFLAEQLRDLLSKAGLAVEWVPFRGAHEIPDQVLTRMKAFLGRVIAT
ncbi:MAG: alpha/beta hydrolase [Nitrospiraceae bacterium]